MAEELKKAYGGKYPFGGGWEYDGSAAYPRYPEQPAEEYHPHPKSLYTKSVSLQAPSYFTLTAIDKDEPPVAPSDATPNLFNDPKVFEGVDQHAVKVSGVKYRTMKDLLWNLIFSRNITNEVEKARAIFRWLCESDPKFLSFSDRPANVTRELNHATAYQLLCQHAGMHCHLIRGYVKLSSRMPGSDVKDDDCKHTWNAVYLQGHWRFIDSCWASRTESGTRNFPGETRKKFDDFYFLPPPFHLISTHFPDEAAWQLLDDPVSKTEFEKRVYCSSYFTKYSLQLLNHRDAEITTDSDVTICVSCPESKVKSTAYMFSLEFDDEGDLMRSQKCNRLVQYHRTLNGYGMIERLGNVAYFTVRPPEKASYRFIIYAKDIETTAKQEKFQSVCSYEIHMEGQKGMSKFPACPRDRWGDTEFLEKYGIVPERTGAVIETSDGLLDIKLKIPKEMDFQVKIKTVQKFATDLEEIVLYRTVKDEAIFTMTFPKPGEYGLEIYTNGERESEAKMQNIIQYLIIAKSASDPSDMLPAVFPGFLGTKPPFKQLKLSADSHEDPIILTNSSDLEVVFSSPQPVNYSTNLIYISRNKYDDLTDHVLRQGQEGGNEVEFLLKLPFAGWYRFEIYAVSRSEQIQKLPNVFNYLINCHIEQEERSPGLRKPSPYPKQFAMWNGGCCLLEPIGGLTPTGGHLEVKIPEAEEVAVIVDGEWTHLEQDNDSWSGDVTIDAGPGREVSVKVSAQFPNKKAFSTLLQYTINT